MHCNMKTKSQCPPQSQSVSMNSSVFDLLIDVFPFKCWNLCDAGMPPRPNYNIRFIRMIWFSILQVMKFMQRFLHTPRWKIPDSDSFLNKWICPLAARLGTQQPHFTLNVGIWTLTSNFGVFVPTSENHVAGNLQHFYSKRFKYSSKQSGKAGDKVRTWLVEPFYSCNWLRERRPQRPRVKERNDHNPSFWIQTGVCTQSAVFCMPPRIVGVWERQIYATHQG